jgi:hypothetical protein
MALSKPLGGQRSRTVPIAIAAVVFLCAAVALYSLTHLRLVGWLGLIPAGMAYVMVRQAFTWLERR